MKIILLFATLISGLLILSGPVSAAEPDYCDSSSDPDGCECPANLGEAGLDDCTESTYANLLQAKDAGALASYVTATWNSTDNLYDVEIDVESMPGGGILRLPTDAGEWDDFSELETFFRTLLGDSNLELPCPIKFGGKCTDVHVLPRMRITQRGVTARFDEDSKTWVTTRTGNLVLDAITDADGDLSINGYVLPIFVDDECPGTDAKSLATDTDGDLNGLQCSNAHAGTVTVQGMDRCISTGCEAHQNQMTTLLETGSTAHFGTSLYCVKDSGSYTCDVVNGWFTQKRVEADSLEIYGYAYRDNFYDEVTVASEGNVMEITHSHTGWDNGTCAHGSGDDGSDVIEIKTRDGDYDGSHSPCDF